MRRAPPRRHPYRHARGPPGLLVGCGATEPPALPAASPGDDRPRPATWRAHRCRSTSPTPTSPADGVPRRPDDPLRRATDHHAEAQSWADQAVVFDQHFAGPPGPSPPWACSTPDAGRGSSAPTTHLPGPLSGGPRPRARDPRRAPRAQGYATIGAVANPNLHARRLLPGLRPTRSQTGPTRRSHGSPDTPTSTRPSSRPGRRARRPAGLRPRGLHRRPRAGPLRPPRPRRDDGGPSASTAMTPRCAGWTGR